MNFNAISRLLLTIGEEVKKIEPAYLELKTNVDWKSIIGLRNRMAHDYRGIDPDIVFDIVRNELLPLKSALMELLPCFSIQKDDLHVVLASPFFRHIGFIADI